MRIHFLRNATFILHTGNERILVDPMLGPKGSLPPLAFIRYRARRNPLVDLPDSAHDALKEITGGLITHCHKDHLDNAGTKLLAKKQVPVYCNIEDEDNIKKSNINTQPVTLGETTPFFGGELTSYKAVHGYGWIRKFMGPGVGYFIKMPGEPSLYISGDTVLTPIVQSVLAWQKPDYAIVAAGTARLDIGAPILMTLSDVLKFTHLAPGKTIAMHMEAVNHCPSKREKLKELAFSRSVNRKLLIPEDGDFIEMEPK